MSPGQYGAESIEVEFFLLLRCLTAQKGSHRMLQSIEETAR